MLISDEKKFIFIHVQKTAGISVETVLKQQEPNLKYWHGRHGHAVNGFKDLGQSGWNEYFSFAFVRNPWDRLVSWYSMIEAAKHKLSIEERSSQTPFKSALWNYALGCSDSFESFLYNCTDIIFDLGCKKSFAYNQLDYLTNESGELVVDFIGRYESLQEDFSKVLPKLGLAQRTLPRLNQSQHKHYSQWYTADTQHLIADRFSRDIEAFDYKFETIAPQYNS